MKLIMLGLYLLVALVPQGYTKGIDYAGISSYRMNYVILPTICIILLLIFAKWFMEVEPMSRNNDKKLAILWAFYFAAIIIVAKMIVGIFMGTLSKNPYDRSFRGIVSNLYYALPLIIFRENIRSYIINKCTHYKMWFISLLFWLSFAGLNFMEIELLNGVENTVIYMAKNVLPLVIEGIFLNMMATYGGAGASIIYLIMQELMEWLFPVVPTLNWLTEFVISIGIGGIIILMLGDQISECQEKHKRNSKKTRRKQEKMFGQICVMVICVVMIWFFVGVFRIYPSVVLTGSMEPDIKPGDMILIDKITNEKGLNELKVGDIITFHRDDIVITHRIKEIVTDENGNITFRTKGDNNSVEDTRLVEPNEVMGRYIGVIPKIGLPVLWIKSGEAVPDDVEN